MIPKGKGLNLFLEILDEVRLFLMEKHPESYRSPKVVLISKQIRVSFKNGTPIRHFQPLQQSECLIARTLYKVTQSGRHNFKLELWQVEM